MLFNAYGIGFFDIIERGNPGHNEKPDITGQLWANVTVIYTKNGPSRIRNQLDTAVMRATQ